MFPIAQFLDSEEDPVVEFDPYVPVTVTWPAYGRQLEPPHSRLVDGGGASLELKCAPGTGNLVEVVLVVATLVMIREETVGIDLDTCRCCVSIAEIGPSSTMQIPIELVAYADGLEIRFGSRERIVRGGSIGYGINVGGELSSLVVGWNVKQRADFINEIR